MARSVHGAGGHEAWSRADVLALVLLVVLLAAGLATLVHPWYDRTQDGSVYLVTSRALAAGEGYTYLGAPFLIRPPGLPLLLVPFVAGGALDFRAINSLVASFGAAMLVLLFLWVRPRLGGILALAIALSIGALPGFQRLSTQVMTDVPGAALLLACVLVERWSARSADLRRQVVLGALIGLSTYMRNGYDLMLLAILASRLLGHLFTRGSRPPWRDFVLRRLVVFASVAALVTLPWSVRNRLSPPELPIDQAWQHSAWTLLWHEDGTDPASPRYGLGEVVGRTLSRLPAIAAELGKLKLARGYPREDPTPATALQYGFGLCLCAALIVSWLRRREPAEAFLSLHCLALAALPMGIVERYTLPLLVFALPAAVELLRGALLRAAGPRLADGILATTLLAGAGVAFTPRMDWPEIQRNHTDLVALTDELARRLPPDARLGAPIGWHLQLFLGRPVYSLRIAATLARSPAAAEGVIDRYDLDTVVMVPDESAGPMQGRLEQYFASQYPGGLEVRVGGGSARIFRVRP